MRLKSAFVLNENDVPFGGGMSSSSIFLMNDCLYLQSSKFDASKRVTIA